MLFLLSYTIVIDVLIQQEYIIDMTKSTENSNFENISFEDALSELESIVKRLDSGAETLESSIDAYERASALKLFCQTKLEEAKFKIEKVTKDSDGAIKIVQTENIV